MLQYQVTKIQDFDHYTRRIEALIAQAAPHADLLLLPEYACMELAAGLTMEPGALAELNAVCAASRDILELFRNCARRHNIWLQPGTIPFRDARGCVHNRAPLISPEGLMAFQDKHVMTRFEAEEWGVQAGRPPAVFETPWGRIGIAICYDCEFPMLVRAQVQAGAWVILVPTCTDTLHGFNRVRFSARARAIENQCFVAVAPTVGDAPWLATLDTNRGQAAVFGPVDRGFPADGVIAEGIADTGGWIFAELDPENLAQVRRDGAVRNHADWPGTVPDCLVLRPQ